MAWTGDPGSLGPPLPISPSLEFLGAASGFCQSKASGPPLPGQFSGVRLQLWQMWAWAEAMVWGGGEACQHALCPTPLARPLPAPPAQLQFSYQTLQTNTSGDSKDSVYSFGKVKSGRRTVCDCEGAGLEVLRPRRWTSAACLRV